MVFETFLSVNHNVLYLFFKKSHCYFLFPLVGNVVILYLVAFLSLAAERFILEMGG